MPAVHVCLHEIAHLRVDALLDLVGEKAFTDLLQVRQWASAQRLGGPAYQLLEFKAPQLMLEARGDQADQFADPHIPAADPFPGENHGGEPRDEGAIEVEECSDLRPGWAGHHLGHRTRESRITRSLAVAHE